MAKGASTVTQPDILFVIFDDLGLVDANQTLMPRSWAFAHSTGVRAFTRTYSMPICSQSRACMEFGKYGRTLGIIETMGTENGPEPPLETTTVASLLKASGYSTALVGKWHLGRNPIDTSMLYVGAPEARGYDHWIAGTPDNVDSFTDWLRVDDDIVTEHVTDYITLVQRDAGLDWWQSTMSPKFLRLSLTAPHGPYNFPPDELLDGFVSTSTHPNRQMYEAEIRSADHVFGQFLDLVSPSTIIVTVGDNGTPPNAPAPGQDPHRNKGTCYESGIRVPLAIRSQFPGGASDRLVHIVDIPATILALAGVAVPSDWDGRSLIGPARATCLSEAQTGANLDFNLVRAAMSSSPHYKLLRTNNAPEELYDLDNDPTELTKLSLTDPANAAILDTLRGVLYG